MDKKILDPKENIVDFDTEKSELNKEYFHNYIKEKKKVFGRITKKEHKELQEKYESSVIKKLESRTKKGFFSWSLIENDDIDFYVVVSNRNIGKSYSAKHHVIERCLERNEAFIWIRNTTQEKKNLIDNWHDWFAENNLECKKGTGVITSLRTKKIVGYIASLSNAYTYKSNDFDNVKVLIFDEFISDGYKVKDAFAKLVSFIISAERQKTDFKVYLLANFLDGEDDILNGLGLSGIGKEDFHANFITRSMIWTIPSNVFKEFKNENSIGYKLSLKSRREYARNYGGTFTNESTKNLQVEEETEGLEKIFILQGISNNCALFLHDSKKDLIIVEYILENEIGKWDCDVFTNDSNVFMRARNTKYIPVEKMKRLIDYWINERIIVNGDVKIRNWLNLTFSKVYEKIEKDDKLVYEVK